MLLQIGGKEKERQKRGRIEAGERYSQLFIDGKNHLNDEQRGEPICMVNTCPDGTYIQERVMQHATHTIKKELGYEKFDFHSLRNTHATELCEAGVNIKEIQRRLGHSTMEVTSKCYLHATELMEDQSVELMNEMHGCPERPSGDDRWRGGQGGEVVCHGECFFNQISPLSSALLPNTGRCDLHRKPNHVH